MSQLEHLTAALRDRYRIERELGRGGMATVYLAEDLKHKRQLAVKVLKPDLARSLGPERFLREIEIAARLHHPHILPLYDSGKADGFLYYVMPYVEGESLRDRLNREKQLPVEDALVIAIEVADALAYAHSRDIIHRDIKPENIMLEADHALVADFGIARAITAAGEATITETGLAVGTPAYMSPEQAGGESQLDGRSDLYSLACVLYEMLAGQPPFTGPNISSVVTQHLSAEPPVVSYLRPGVPEEIVATLHAALAKTPADRPATARQFVDSMTGRRPSRSSARIPTARAKRPWMLAGIAVGAVAVGAVLATVLRGGGNGVAAGIGTVREWVLVAEFEGSADEAHLKMGRSLVETVLDQSRLVTTLPRDQVDRGLLLSGRSDSAAVTEDVARELAVRGSIGAVVTGQIDRAGSTYSVLLRVVDPENGTIVTAVNGLAMGDNRLIPVTDSLARSLREGLGEQADQIRSDRPLVEVATPSFEAYRKFVQANELNASRNATGARRIAREALSLDPDFAAAYRLVGYTFFNVGQRDSAVVAFEAARRRPERLTEQERLELEAFTAFVLDRDAERALGAYDQLLAVNPNIPLARTGRGNVLFLLGRFEEALEEFRRVVEISPFGPTPLNLSNIFGTLLNLRRVAEADSIWRMMEGETWRDAAIELALAQEDWAGAERMANDHYNDPATPGYMALALGLWLSSALSVQGSIEAADTVMAVSRERAVAAGAASDAAILDRSRWLLAVASEGSVGDPSDLTWAEGGDDPDLAAGARHAVQHEWQEVVALLGIRAAAGQVTGIPGTALERWLVASAYEQLGRSDSAAHYYELVVDPPRIDWLDRFRHGVTYAFGHRKLAALYDAMGRADEAARHRAIADSLPDD